MCAWCCIIHDCLQSSLAFALQLHNLLSFLAASRIANAAHGELGIVLLLLVLLLLLLVKTKR